MRTLLPNKLIIGLSLIMLLGAVVRVIGISHLPSGFHNDEASFFINALALKQTGMDEDGRSFPLYLYSFIDPKPAFYSYLQIPFITLFGNTVLAARLPGVILGVLSLLVLYFLTSSLIHKKGALILTFLAAINPWHIILSRGTQEVITSFFFSLLAIFLLIKNLQRKTVSPLLTGLFMITTFLAMYSYHSAKLFLPFLFLFLLWYFFIHKKNTVIMFGVILITCVFAILFTSSQGGLVRANAISIFSDPKTQLILDEEIRTATPFLPQTIIRLAHNKVVNYSLAVLTNYSDYFTGSFLFFKGGQPGRLAVPFSGLFYIIEIIVLIYGLFIGFSKERYKKVSLFFLVWLLLSPLSAVVTTQEIPSITRSAFLLVPVLFFISIALFSLIERRKERRVLIMLCLLVIGYVGSICYFANQYIIQSQVYHPWSRNYADEQLVQKIKQRDKEYKSVYVKTGRDSYVYFVLANMFSIEQLQKSYPARTKDTFTLSHYTFSKINECVLPKQENTLFIFGIACKIKPNTGFSVVDTASYKDNAPEYQLVEYQRAQDKSFSQPISSPN